MQRRARAKALWPSTGPARRASPPSRLGCPDRVTLAPLAHAYARRPPPPTAGLTSVSLPTLGFATLLGTLPSQAAYVTAGALGQQALSGQLSVPPAVLIAGSLATVGAVVIGGKVAQTTLARMDFDSNGTKPKRARQLA